MIRQAEHVAHEERIAIEGTVDEIRLAGDLHLPAAVVGKSPGGLGRISHAGEGIEDQFFVVDSNYPAAVPHDLGDPLEELFVGMPVQADRDGEVRDAELFEDVENEIGHGIRDVLPVRADPGEDDVLVVLGVAAPRRGVRHDPLAALDEEVREDFTGLVEGKAFFGEIALEIRPEHLVDPPDPRPVPREAREREGDPQALYGFVECPGGLHRNAFEEGVAFRVLLRGFFEDPTVPETEGRRGALQIGGIGPVGVFVELRFDSVQPEREDPPEAERHMTDGGQYRASATVSRHDMADGCAESRRSDDAFAVDKTERTLRGDGLDGAGVLFVGGEYVKIRDSVEGDGGMGDRLVAVLALHALEGVASRFFGQTDGSFPARSAWDDGHKRLR